jgi:hypothetical protein
MLRAKLARAVGDPSLEVAYRLLAPDGYVDEAGQPMVLPAVGGSRRVTYLHEGGRQIGALIHDAAVLDDPVLVNAVAALGRGSSWLSTPTGALVCWRTPTAAM